MNTKNNIINHLNAALEFASTPELVQSIEAVIRQAEDSNTKYQWTDFETGECILELKGLVCSAKMERGKWACVVNGSYDGLKFIHLTAHMLPTLVAVEKVFLAYIDAM